MRIHELAIFWRDEKARCFTNWHFRPAHGEQATERAAQILALLQQLSNLQIYGAVLDGAPLQREEAKAAPPSGTDIRLQVDLYPEKDLNPGQGINYLRFSIPGPLTKLIDSVESQRFSQPLWLDLGKEVFPYLCLPNGVSVKTEGERVYRAEIKYLMGERRPQPNHPPLEAAINYAFESLEKARQGWQTHKTPHEQERVEKAQTRLDARYTWQHLEKNFFDQIDSLHLLPAQPDESPTVVAEPDRPAPTVLDILLTASASQINSQSNEKEEATPMTDTQTQIAAQGETYLPTPPSPEQIHAWQDVPPADLQDSQMWWYRDQIKQLYNLSERSFFRWLETLRSFGLTRWLPAQGKPLLRLYYRPDLEMAVQKFQTATAASPLHGRPRKALSAVSPQTDAGGKSSPVTSSPQAEIHIQPPPHGQVPMASHPDLAPPIVPVAPEFFQHPVFLELQAKSNSLEQTLVKLQERFDSLAAQVQHQAQAQQQGAKDEILVAIDKLARKLLRRSSAQIPIAKARKSKTRSARKPKSAPARARTSSPAKTVKANQPSQQQKIKTAHANTKTKQVINKTKKKKSAHAKNKPTSVIKKAGKKKLAKRTR